ncbi:Oxo-4-hydroxy-4-carboxy-5-ureidoimidazoline decarboxylase [Xylariales sp. AK1849]|nr:Oxo-4-hydroxy-4-carboxy-5-ureidoimidazoline decarboxylase [Xylariales sp. AK1849]
MASASASASSSASSSTLPPTSLPPISSVPTAPMKTQIQVLDLLFEPSKELHTIALPALKTKRRPANPGLSDDLSPTPSVRQITVPELPFTSYWQLIQHIGLLLTQLSQSSEASAKQKLHSILASHPRLGAKKVESAQSQAEQAQLNAGGEEESQTLRKLNEHYEAKFPGLRYVVFVNGRSRPVIMANMQERINRGDLKEEEQEAIRAMVDIALDRAGKLEATTEPV